MGAASGKAASGSERDGDNSSSSNMAIMINAEAAASSSGSAAEWVPGWLHSLLPCSYVSDMVAELYRRVKLEVIVEWPMLKDRWKIILFGIVMQYVHGIFTQLAHRMHQPQQEPLHDVGFLLTPELGPSHFWVSECLFGSLFALFVVWTFSPFVQQRKRFYTAVLWSRLLMVLVVCQALRIVTFSVTQLPGPSFHCRADQPTAYREWPAHWTGHLVVDVSRQVTKSCGDLIFSSHTTFVLTGVLAYTEYGSWLPMKVFAWAAAAVLSGLIVASRKHYTVDVVIAWYTVPLVFLALYRRWTTRRPVNDLSSSSAGSLLNLGGMDGMYAVDEEDPEAGSGHPLLSMHAGGHAHGVGSGGIQLQQVLVEKAGSDSKFEKHGLSSAARNVSQKALLAGLHDGVHTDVSDVGSKPGAGGAVVVGGGVSAASAHASHPRSRSVTLFSSATVAADGGGEDRDRDVRGGGDDRSGAQNGVVQRTHNR